MCSPPTEEDAKHPESLWAEADILLQTSEDQFDEKLALLAETIAALEAHATGCQSQAKRFSNILGIPEVKN